MNKFEVGKLYTWVPEPEPDEPKYMNEYYMVWKPNRKDIWKKDSYGVYPGTELLRQKSIVTVLECYKNTDYSDLKILSTTGVCGWVRVGKEFYNDWHLVSV